MKTPSRIIDESTPSCGSKQNNNEEQATILLQQQSDFDTQHLGNILLNKQTHIVSPLSLDKRPAGCYELPATRETHIDSREIYSSSGGERAKHIAPVSSVQPTTTRNRVQVAVRTDDTRIHIFDKSTNPSECRYTLSESSSIKRKPLLQTAGTNALMELANLSRRHDLMKGRQLHHFFQPSDDIRLTDTVRPVLFSQKSLGQDVGLKNDVMEQPMSPPITILSTPSSPSSMSSPIPVLPPSEQETSGKGNYFGDSTCAVMHKDDPSASFLFRLLLASDKAPTHETRQQMYRRRTANHGSNENDESVTSSLSPLEFYSSDDSNTKAPLSQGVSCCKLLLGSLQLFFWFIVLVTLLISVEEEAATNMDIPSNNSSQSSVNKEQQTVLIMQERENKKCKAVMYGAEVATRKKLGMGNDWIHDSTVMEYRYTEDHVDGTDNAEDKKTQEFSHPGQSTESEGTDKKNTLQNLESVSLSIFSESTYDEELSIGEYQPPLLDTLSNIKSKTLIAHSGEVKINSKTNETVDRYEEYTKDEHNATLSVATTNCSFSQTQGKVLVRRFESKELHAIARQNIRTQNHSRDKSVSLAGSDDNYINDVLVNFKEEKNDVYRVGKMKVMISRNLSKNSLWQHDSANVKQDTSHCSTSSGPEAHFVSTKQNDLTHVRSRNIVSSTDKESPHEIPYLPRPGFSFLFHATVSKQQCPPIIRTEIPLVKPIDEYFGDLKELPVLDDAFLDVPLMDMAADFFRRKHKTTK
jgi:hypothetical protein